MIYRIVRYDTNPPEYTVESKPSFLFFTFWSQIGDPDEAICDEYGWWCRMKRFRSLAGAQALIDKMRRYEDNYEQRRTGGTIVATR